MSNRGGIAYLALGAFVTLGACAGEPAAPTTEKPPSDVTEAASSGVIRATDADAGAISEENDSVEGADASSESSPTPESGASGASTSTAVTTVTSTPTVVTKPTSDDASTTVAITSGDASQVRFIPWSELTNEGLDDEPLQGPLELRSVSASSGYEQEDLLVTVAVPNGNNRVIAVDTSARTFREHWLHFDCGDCKAVAGSGHAVVVTTTDLYASTDGGYRYWDLAQDVQLGMDTSFQVRVVGTQVWVWSSSVWLNAPLIKNTTFELLPWDRGIWSVWEDTGLQTSTVFVRRRLVDEPDGAVHEKTDNPCELPHEYYDFGLTAHDDERTVIACSDATMAVSANYPEAPFALWLLDAPPLWVSTAHAATTNSWYSTKTKGPAVGAQAPLAPEEVVYGYVSDVTHGLRVSNLGIAVSALAAPQTE